MNTLAKKVAQRFLAREGEIASNPAIEAMGAHLDGDDEPSKHIKNLSPAAERFDGGPKKNPFGPQNRPPERGGRPPWGDDESKPAQKSIPGEKNAAALRRYLADPALAEETIHDYAFGRVTPNVIDTFKALEEMFVASPDWKRVKSLIQQMASWNVEDKKFDVTMKSLSKPEREKFLMEHESHKNWLDHQLHELVEKLFRWQGYQR